MRIFRLELKRVLKSRPAWILMVLALLLSILLAYLPTTYCYSSYTDEAGNKVNLTGLASIAYEKVRQAGAAGIVTPERVREAVEIYQACLTSYAVQHPPRQRHQYPLHHHRLPISEPGRSGSMDTLCHDRGLYY